jgi:heme-degrading monooxygenase HmoA
MIIVQDTFVCKPGNASKLAKLFKEVMEGQKDLVNILSYVTGQFNRVIVVTKHESLEAYEKSWDNMSEADKKKMQEKMKDYTEMYQSGSREIFKVW